MGTMNEWLTRKSGTPEQRGRRFKVNSSGIKGSVKSKVYKPSTKQKTTKQVLIDNAIEYFGLTEDPRKGGFILEDGNMLNFGEGMLKEHDKISQALLGKGHISASMPLLDYFRTKTDSIRMDFGNIGSKEMSVELSVEINKTLTAQQKARMLKIFYQYKEKGYSVDMSYEVDNVGGADGLFENVKNPNQVISHIESDLKRGKNPLTFKIDEKKSQSLIDYHKNQRQETHSARLVWMPPEQFLSEVAGVSPNAKNALEDYQLNGEKYFDKGSLNSIEYAIKKGEKVAPLELEYDNVAFGKPSHEGRHRAVVALKLGIKKVPVVVVGIKGEDIALKKLTNLERWKA